MFQAQNTWPRVAIPMCPNRLKNTIRDNFSNVIDYVRCCIVNDSARRSLNIEYTLVIVLHGFCLMVNIRQNQNHSWTMHRNCLL